MVHCYAAKGMLPLNGCSYPKSKIERNPFGPFHRQRHYIVLGIQKSNYPLDGGLIRQIIRYYEDMDVNFCIPKDGVLLGYRNDKYIQMLSKADQLPYKVVDFNELLRSPQGKLIIICSPHYMPHVIEHSKKFSNSAYKLRLPENCERTFRIHESACIQN